MDIVINPQPAALEPGRLAGQKFGVRAAAYVIDQFVMLALTWASAVVGAIMPTLLLVLFASASELAEMDDLTSWILPLLLDLLYFVLCEWLFGASPGKVVLSLRVVRDDGSRCSFRAALVRGLLRFVDGILFGLVGYVHMKPPQYQRHGDDVARTVVVKASEVAPERRRSLWWLVLALALYGFLATSILGSYWTVRAVTDPGTRWFEMDYKDQRDIYETALH